MKTTVKEPTSTGLERARKIRKVERASTFIANHYDDLLKVLTDDEKLELAARIALEVVIGDIPYDC